MTEENEKKQWQKTMIILSANERFNIGKITVSP